MRLREASFKIGIITNGVAVKQWEKIIRLGLNDFFHTVVISEDLETHKPNKIPFDKACANIGVNPTVCIFVGDRFGKDIRGGNLVGMTTVLFKGGSDSGDLQGDLIEKPDHIIISLSEILTILDLD